MTFGSDRPTRFRILDLETTSVAAPSPRSSRYTGSTADQRDWALLQVLQPWLAISKLVESHLSVCPLIHPVSPHQCPYERFMALPDPPMCPCAYSWTPTCLPFLLSECGGVEVVLLKTI